MVGKRIGAAPPSFVVVVVGVACGQNPQSLSENVHAFYFCHWLERFFFTLHIPYEYEVQRMLDGKPFELNRIVASVFDGGGALVGMSASFVSLTGTDDGIIMKMHEKRKHLK